MTDLWDNVKEKLLENDTDGLASWLNAGQRDSLSAIARNLPQNGMILADAVGMGKTRIAVQLAKAVRDCGGRVAILVPPGLGYQWQDELSEGKVKNVPPILRSLWQYFSAWSADNEEKAKPWFDEEVVVISHSFANWRLSEKAEPWRWSLLPLLYGEYIKGKKGSYPRGYHKLNDPWVKSAAESLWALHYEATLSLPLKMIGACVNKDVWSKLLKPESYSRKSSLRAPLERAVGIGLGKFDLIIIDEAHKSRGVDSSLSRLLESVILTDETSRRLAMSATPVELDAGQWIESLQRIGVKEDERVVISDSIKDYVDAVRRVRSDLRNKEVRDEFKRAASNFENKLRRYVLRRDKREDTAVKLFEEKSKESFDQYRRVTALKISTKNLSMGWKTAVCAAEALSMLSDTEKDVSHKRLRLTIGNGHGLALLSSGRHETEGRESGHEEQKAECKDGAEGIIEKKQAERADWWRKTLQSGVDVVEKERGTSGSCIFNHPAINAAVEKIEEVTAETKADGPSEKVLVFGKFTLPMKALVALLNARNLLQCLHGGKSLPQSSLSACDHECDDDCNRKCDHQCQEDGDCARGWDLHALRAAHVQLKSTIHLDEVESELKRQYEKLEKGRYKFRAELSNAIALYCDSGNRSSALPQYLNERAQALFLAFGKSVSNAGSKENSKALVARALNDLADDAKEVNVQKIFVGFGKLVEALSDRDEGNADGNGALDKNEAAALWPILEKRLSIDYSGVTGTYARLMHGATEQSSRRMMQLAFNQSSSHLKVLVAQSMVGREGLNLHKECRTVVLLHSEWNPAIVEQQIGRVDRMDSLWSKKLGKAIDNEKHVESFPRIDIHPIIFEGTYDEHQWDVLQERWDELKAQLHGIIIYRGEGENTPEIDELVKEMQESAPNFSPKMGASTQ